MFSQSAEMTHHIQHTHTHTDTHPSIHIHEEKQQMAE